MKYLYYTRHGESYANTGRVWSTAIGSLHDQGLTEKGRNQARESALRTKDAGVKPDRIICSPLVRTRETAAIMADILGYPVEDIEYNDLFLEVHVGELEGTSFDRFIERYTYADFDKFEGAETIEALQQRAAEALDLIKSYPEETILIVSHSCFGRALRRVIEGRPFTDEFLPSCLPLPYGEITQLLPPVK